MEKLNINPTLIGFGVKGSWCSMFIVFYLFMLLGCDAVPMNIADKSIRINYDINSTTSLADSEIQALATNNLIQRSGCRYKGNIYGSGDSVPTDESCLFCHCKGSIVICKLRICPEVPDPPPPSCIVVQKANKCCSQLVCNDNHARKISREQRLSTENGSLPLNALDTLEKDNYCVHDGTVYAEGSAMRSSTLCEHCFCIHGVMKCSSPQCIIPLNGCKPRYRSYACCPTNYDCNLSNETAILQTIPSSSPIPQFLKGCTVQGRYVAEGEPVLPMQIASTGNNTGINPCQTCFCMGGVVHCRPLECDRKIEGCRPILEEGHCCPDRYECDKHSTTTPMTPIPTTMLDTTTQPEESITLIEEINTEIPKMFHKVPLLRARKDDEAEVGEWTTLSLKHSDILPSLNGASQENSKPRTIPTDLENLKKKARISYTSAGGFMNRSDLGGGTGGSREIRRKKDRVEYLSRSFYDDDAREDSSSSFENSRQHSEEQTSKFFEDKSDRSISNSDGDESTNSDMEPILVTEINDVKVDEVVTETDNEGQQEPTTTIQYKLESILDENTTLDAGDISNNTLSLDISPSGKISLKTGADPTTATSTTSTTTGTPIVVLSSSTEKRMSSTPISSSSTPEDLPPTTNNGGLEFIAFGVEDALAFPSINETKYEIYPGQQTSLSYDSVAQKGSLLPALSQKRLHSLKPLKLAVPQSLIADDPSSSSKSKPSKDIIDTALLQPVPIIVENENDEKLQNNIIDIPVQTSLYNNGFYGFVDNDDDKGKEHELIITQAEIPILSEQVIKLKSKYTEGSSENIGIGEALPEANTPTLMYSTTTTIRSTTKNTKKPLKDNVSPISYTPIFEIKNNNTRSQGGSQYPSRTYSKFGIQDSSYFRYGVPNTNGFVPSAPLRPSQMSSLEFYSPPTIGPQSTRISQPQRNTNTMIHRKVPSSQIPEHIKSRLRYNPYQPFEDELSNYGDGDDDESLETGSYETFFETVQTTPAISTSAFRQRFGTPLKATGHIHSSSNTGFNPMPMISSSGSLVSMSKDTTTKRPGSLNTKIINSKPLRRPKPIEDQHIDSTDPLGFKPVVAFPFQIPKSQDNFNMGLKLSGCNIYGKMYNVGQIIHELSSICVQCRCTEVGVQCSELQC